MNQELAALDAAHLWHPWSPAGMARPVMVSGAGSYISDINGKRYLDAKGGTLNAACGYAHPDVIAAITDQATRLMVADLATASTIPAIRLAERLAGLLPGPLNRTLFCSSGSEAAEAAVKLARMYHRINGRPDREIIVSLDLGYHGATMGAMALTSAPFVHELAGPPAAGFRAVPAPTRARVRAAGADAAVRTADELDDLIVELGPDRVAAFVMEPVLGIGGVVVPPVGYLTRVEEICRRHGVLLILDEVLTGFGRTGLLFGMNRESLVPDIVTTSKGLSGGYVPLAAVTATDEIYHTVAKDPLLGGFRHGHTAAGHPLACAAALAVIDVIERDGLVSNADRIGALLKAALLDLVGHRVADIRGHGLLIGIELDTEDEAERITADAFRDGLILRQQRDVITICPPLALSENEADFIVRVTADAVTASRDRVRA